MPTLCVDRIVRVGLIANLRVRGVRRFSIRQDIYVGFSVSPDQQCS
ncbi:MAG TPA: hypothetical protein VF311_03855 [Terriglobales bacterium]|jgi:hypothetical protein